MTASMQWLRLPTRGDPRLVFLAILSFYVLLGITVLGFNRSPGQILIIVALACALDMGLHRLLKGAWLFPLSAAITGMSLAILVNYAHGYWLLWVPVFLAIASKYLFTFQGRHVFNPSLFGVVASLWLADGMISAAPAYQWGGAPAMAAFVVTLALSLFVFRIGRSTLILAFLVFYSLALGLRAWLLQHHLPPETLILGALSSPAFYLYTFFMITDPATSPPGRVQQVLMALFIVLVDLLLHSVQSLSTLFYAAFAYFSLRWLVLHLGKLYKQPKVYRQGMLSTVRAWVVFALLGGLGWTGYQYSQAAIEARPTDFKLQILDATWTGIEGEPGDILTRVDPGLQHIAKWLLSVGDAVAVADFDNDGYQDIFLTHSLKRAEQRAVLYRNLGDFRFQAVALPALDDMRWQPETAGLPSGALWWDYDNDADADLLVLAGFGQTRLLRNNLQETGVSDFTDVSATMGIDPYTISLTANAIDMDRDGRLDLIIGNAMNPWLAGYATPTAFNIFRLPAAEFEGDRRMYAVMHRSWHNAANGGENLFYFNRDKGFQRAELAELGLQGQRWTLDIGTGDLNGDGWTDLYLANDFGPDQLYLNRNGQSFELLQGRLVGELGRDTYKGMNASLGDTDGNGTLDIYVSNVHVPLQAEGSLLWANDGQVDQRGYRAFRDVASARNALNPQRFGWGAALGDIDRDGRLDILQANGMLDNSYDPLYTGCPDYWYWNEKIALTGPDVHGYADRWADLRGRCIFPYEANRVLLNRGRYFEDVAAQVGWDTRGNSRGIALADLDNDGDLDVIVTHQFAAATLYRNDSQPRHWIGLALQGNGHDCNRDALGTRVEIQLPDGSARQWREVHASNGFSAQGDRRLLFGLGDAVGNVEIRVHWCGAQTADTYTRPVDHYHSLIQRP